MAHHSATIKSIRQTKKRTARNTARVTNIRGFIKKVDVAIEKNDSNLAKEALRAAQSALLKGVNKGVFKLKTASRKISRLSAKIKAIGSAKPVKSAAPTKAKTAKKKQAAKKTKPAAKK